MKDLFDATDTLIIGIDLQEKLLKVVQDKEILIKNANILLEGARILGVKTLLSEQYPKGLGTTDKAINAQGAPKYEKMAFSVLKDEAIKQEILSLKPKNLVFLGVEAHICVLFSALDALDLGFKVCVIEDALSSRKAENKAGALSFMRHAGAKTLCVESFLFGVLKTAQSAHFKAISALIK